MNYVDAFIDYYGQNAKKYSCLYLLLLAVAREPPMLPVATKVSKLINYYTAATLTNVQLSL